MHRRATVLVTASALVLLLVGACSVRRQLIPKTGLDIVESLQAEIEDHIEDPARAARLRGQADELGTTAERYYEQVGAALEGLRETSEEHDATVADFEPALGEIAAAHQSMTDDFIRIRLEMRSMVTREEWDLLAGKGFVRRKLEQLRERLSRW